MQYALYTEFKRVADVCFWGRVAPFSTVCLRSNVECYMDKQSEMECCLG